MGVRDTGSGIGTHPYFAMHLQQGVLRNILVLYIIVVVR